MWELDHKKSEYRRVYAFELWYWRRFLRVPWTTKDMQITPSRKWSLISQPLNLNFWMDLVTYFQDYCMERGNSTFTIEKPGKNFLLINTISPWKSYFFKECYYVSHNLQCFSLYLEQNFYFLPCFLDRTCICFITDVCSPSHCDLTQQAFELRRTLWDFLTWKFFCVLLFLFVRNRHHPSWPFLCSKGQIQIVANQGRNSQETTWDKIKGAREDHQI